MQFIDLSLPLESVPSEPEPIVIERIDHFAGAELLTRNSQVSPSSFPDGMGLNFERVKLTSHSGTHVDAPLHYGPHCHGKKAKSIDELPLNTFFGTAVVLDCRNNSNESTISELEIKKACVKQKITISPGDIVLLYTGADKLWGSSAYFTDFRGVSLSANEMLLDLGVNVIGVDSFGFDAPFHKMLKAYQRTGNQQELWPCHMLGRSREYFQIERLTNLGSLPLNKKFNLSCFPIKLSRCGAAPARVVAMF